MKKHLLLSLAFLLGWTMELWAQSGKSLDDQINEFMEPITTFVASIVFFPIPGTTIPFVLVWLIFGAIFFTFYFTFPNIRFFKLAINVVSGKYASPKASDSVYTTEEGDIPKTIRVEGAEEGEVTHFQALTAALSGTVGLGNIGGVAIAISLGGPGATFWMIMAGILGMATKFTECTLGVAYREVDADGTVHGGPMYYLSKGLAERGPVMAIVGKFLAAFFAVMCVGGSFGGGNMFQVNQAFKQFEVVTGGIGNSFATGYGWVFGLVMAIMVAIVIIGGIKNIARVTDKIVPFMCVVYVIGALIVLGAHFTQIPAAFGAIFKGAFAPDAAFGGFVGVLIQGFKRAAFSNEAGVGSASIAHSAVKTKHPASEGIVALLEPFIDTVVICTMTALVIIITGKYLEFAGDTSTFAGVQLTSSAFESVLWFFPYVLCLAVCLFAFSTMITWSYYGLQAWQYLFGKSKIVDLLYKFIFLFFVVVGAAMSLGQVTDFSDCMIFAMAFANMFGLYLLAPRVTQELKKYLAHIKSLNR